MKIKIEYVFLILLTLGAIKVVAPLFETGYHLNIDSPAQFLRIWCLDQQGIVPSNWCPAINAGNPTSQYYYPLIDQSIVILGKLIGLNLAYKLAVALAVFSIGLGAYVLLRSRGFKIAPVVALGLLLFNKGSWHFAGFEQTVLVGMWHYILSIGFLLLAVAAFAWFIENPKKNSLIAAVLSTALFTHPMTLVMAVVIYLCLGIAYYKEILQHRVWFTKFVAGAIGINVYFILPLITRLKLFITYPSSGYSMQDFMSYVGSRISWYIIILAIAGIATLYFSHKKAKPVTAFIVAVALVAFSNFFDFGINAVLPGIRTGAFIAPMIFILASLGVELIGDLTPKPAKAFAAPVLALILLGVVASSFFDQNQSVLLSGQPYFAPQQQLYEGMKQLPKGRVVAEETLYNIFTNEGPLPQAFTHSHSVLPIVSGHELIGFGPYFFPKGGPNFWNVDKGDLFGKKVSDWNATELNAIFEKYNIRYVVSHGADWTNYFATIATPIGQVQPFVVFATNVSGSWFATKGKIITESYDGFSGEVTVEAAVKATVTQKSNYYPTWGAIVDGQHVEVKNCEGLICVDITEGTHTIKFFQKWTRYEWIGYTITLLTIIGLMLL